MKQDDRVEQALDSLLKAMNEWYCIRITGHIHIEPRATILANAYEAWQDASKPPGDPHKEWVDAEKLKPPDIFTVLVKRPGHEPAIGRYNPHTNGWSVQPYGGTTYLSVITHWRYIPQDDDNG